MHSPFSIVVAKLTTKKNAPLPMNKIIATLLLAGETDAS